MALTFESVDEILKCNIDTKATEYFDSFHLKSCCLKFPLLPHYIKKMSYKEHTSYLVCQQSEYNFAIRSPAH